VNSRYETQVISPVISPELETQDASIARAQENPSKADQKRRMQRAILSISNSLNEHVRATMPDSAYREMFLWGLNPANEQYENWLQVIGTKQIVYFAAQVMGSMFGENELTALVDYAAPMNVYLTFEVISDNLAFGLTDRLNHDTTYFLRAHLMHHFNQRMCYALKNPWMTAEQALGGERHIADRISVFEQSLSPSAHARLAEAFLSERRDVSLFELEYGLYPLLVTNFYACADLYHGASEMQLGKIIQRGLYQRYHTADRVLYDPHLDISRLVSASTYSILIMPVVAHYLEGVALSTGIADRLSLVTDDNLMFRALYHTAMLIRLLNDMGTQVLKQDYHARTQLIMQLQDQARRTRTHNIHAFLRDVSDGYGAVMTRIAKDVKHGEFNMTLYNLKNAPSLEEAVTMFGERLHYFSNLYERGYYKLQGYLEEIAQRLGDDRLSLLMLRAVRFHEEMYWQEYTKSTGEYAIVKNE
jgi:hypothetical protein